MYLLMFIMLGYALTFLLIVICKADAQTGERCITPSGDAGQCIELQNCQTALDNLFSSTTHDESQNCGFTEDAVNVCCALDSETSSGYEDGCDPVAFNKKYSPRTGKKAWQKCLEYQARLVHPCVESASLGGGKVRVPKCHHNTDKLIIGGEAAEEHEFPHMVLVGYGSRNKIGWHCGGSLISERFVLTAGHCISAPQIGKVSYVWVGAYDKNNVDESKIYNVKSIIKHPDYKPPQQYHDIMLLELDRNVPLDEFTVPACLNVQDDINISEALATGWGLTSYKGKSSQKLQRVILQNQKAECINRLPPRRLMRFGFQAEFQMCFGDPEGKKDTCQGDSGGPIQIKSKEIQCMYTILGVTSNGKGCAFEKELSLYTRVSYYVDWIESIVWP